MFDASKYAEHFSDETPDEPPPSPALLAALRRLEREFSEILRTQQPEATGRSA